MTYEDDDRNIFPGRLDAFVWGLLGGACLIGIAAILGRVLWQIVQ